MVTVFSKLKLLLIMAVLMLLGSAAFASPRVVWYNGIQYSNICRAPAALYYFSYPTVYPVGSNCSFTFDGVIYHYGIITSW